MPRAGRVLSGSPVGPTSVAASLRLIRTRASPSGNLVVGFLPRRPALRAWRAFLARQQSRRRRSCAALRVRPFLRAGAACRPSPSPGPGAPSRPR